MSKDTDNLLVVFSLCLIFGLAVNMVVYHKGLMAGVKQNDNRVMQLESALKLYNIEMPK